MSDITLDIATQCLLANIEANIPTMLWSPPGVGKSDTVRYVGDLTKRTVIDFRAALRDPVDLRGLPLVDAKAGTTRWLPPAELPQVGRDGKRGILFMDELNAASRMMMAACFGLVLERKVGEYTLPDEWAIVAAGNRVLDRAAANSMPTALRNRFAHLSIVPDLQSWCNWAARTNLHPLVTAFVRFRPELLHKMPEGEENSFPTPRAWERVAKICEAKEGIRQHLVSALVGDGPAAEFEGFIRVYKNLPSISDILADPKHVHCPSYDEPAQCYALATGLARRVDKTTFLNAMTYIERLPREFNVMFVIDAIKKQPDLKNTKAFTGWFARNSDVLI